jgi:hypothetical protein
MAQRLDESRREVKPRRYNGVIPVIGCVILPQQSSSATGPKN